MSRVRLEVIAAILLTWLAYAALHAWAVEKADQRAHGERALPAYDCYAFKPQPDISAYDLAQIIARWPVGLLDAGHMNIETARLDEAKVRHHFRLLHGGPCE